MSEKEGKRELGECESVSVGWRACHKSDCLVPDGAFKAIKS